MSGSLVRGYNLCRLGVSQYNRKTPCGRNPALRSQVLLCRSRAPDSHADQLGTFPALDRKQDSLGSEDLKKLFSQCFITEEIVLKSLKIHDPCLDISEINSRIKFGRSLNCFAAFGSAACLNLAVLSEYPV